jgi:hypothetical protein
VSSSRRTSGPALPGRAHRGQRALADDHGVHELHGDVADVRLRLTRFHSEGPSGPARRYTCDLSVPSDSGGGVRTA